MAHLQWEISTSAHHLSKLHVVTLGFASHRDNRLNNYHKVWQFTKKNHITGNPARPVNLRSPKQPPPTLKKKLRTHRTQYERFMNMNVLHRAGRPRWVQLTTGAFPDQFFKIFWFSLQSCGEKKYYTLTRMHGPNSDTRFLERRAENELVIMSKEVQVRYVRLCCALKARMRSSIGRCANATLSGSDGVSMLIESTWS